MNLNLKGKAEHTFDAIVVGSGISGGWAAKELTEKGLKVLLIDRGKDIKHIEDYNEALKAPWELPHRNRLSNEMKAKFPIQSKEGNYPINEANQAFWMDEKIQPYLQDKQFDWYRGAGTGGKSLIWGRQVYRWSDLDFEANAKEGIAIDWPIRYKDIAPWYAYVEKFVGVSGSVEGLPHLPDSVFQPAMEMNCVEKDFKAKINSKFGANRTVTMGRVAHLTSPTDEQKALGRGSCQYRNACSAGCPYGAYFSTQSATLPAATKTGNLTLLNNALVSQIVFDSKANKASGVEVIDILTKKSTTYHAKIIFLNASTIATTQILLNSVTEKFPGGMGNDSGQLGKNLMDHHSRAGANASVDGYEDLYYYGRRANGIFVPRFRNVGSDKRAYLRGFDFQGGAGRNRQVAPNEFGVEFKNNASKPGSWGFGLVSFGECLPYEENIVTLDKTQKDAFGMPLIRISAEFKANEKAMRVDMANDAAEMLNAAGFKNIKSFNSDKIALGLSKHEMGTARMGNDRKTSVLNKNNQVWGCENVFVTDGAAMVSSGCVNPSLTYMALTARACDFAVKELKKMNL
jgi:choline dehydrogenase-like flavoprotein